MTDKSLPDDGHRETTPATRKGNIRRNAILDAAEEVLVESGHSALTMRAVADRADIWLGNLQYYFPHRPALIGALLDRILTRSLENIEALADGEGTLPEPTRVIGALLAEQTDQRLVRLFVELWALAAIDGTVARAVREFYRAYSGLVARAIADARPNLPEQIYQAKAEAFVALMEGSSLLRSGIAGAPSPALDAELERLAVMLLAGD